VDCGGREPENWFPGPKIPKDLSNRIAKKASSLVAMSNEYETGTANPKSGKTNDLEKGTSREGGSQIRESSK